MSNTFSLKYDQNYAGPAVIILQNAAHNDDGEIQVTPDCFSINELEHEVERLTAELRTILTKARPQFAYKPKKLFVDAGDA